MCCERARLNVAAISKLFYFCLRAGNSVAIQRASLARERTNRWLTCLLFPPASLGRSRTNDHVAVVSVLLKENPISNRSNSTLPTSVSWLRRNINREAHFLGRVGLAPFASLHSNIQKTMQRDSTLLTSGPFSLGSNDPLLLLVYGTTTTTGHTGQPPTKSSRAAPPAPKTVMKRVKSLDFYAQRGSSMSLEKASRFSSQEWPCFFKAAPQQQQQQGGPQSSSRWVSHFLLLDTKIDGARYCSIARI
jgi:hypothetical protein